MVNAALAGRNLVVQGPPGTGKSQTIANVIAALVAGGKRVLFVAQKRAAITAVLDRLEAVGLGEITLDLFAAGASRRYMAEQLGKVLDRQSSVGEPVTAALHQALSASRDLLVSHRDALHTKRHAWDVTVAQLLALAAAIPATAATSLRLPSQTLASWAPTDLEAHAYNLGELAGKGGLEPGRLTRASWSPAALITAGRVADANEALIRVSSELLPATMGALDAVAMEFGSPVPTTPHQAKVLLNELAESAALAGLGPRPQGGATSMQREMPRACQAVTEGQINTRPSAAGVSSPTHAIPGHPCTRTLRGRDPSLPLFRWRRPKDRSTSS